MDKAKVRAIPELYQSVKKAADEYRKELKKELPKYSYPLEVITATMVSLYAKYGVPFSVYPDECARISELDAQKEHDKQIFGGGYLISEQKAAEKAAAEKAAAEKAAAEKAAAEKAAAEKAAAEKAAAEKAAAEKAAAMQWSLSEREKEIVKNLGKGGKKNGKKDK
jgi:flagellar biosynthesis GTPase FlhF